MRLVFVGAGHAHLYSLKRARRFLQAGCEVVLVSPSHQLNYSGMATGVLSGRHRPQDATIDTAALVESGGGEYTEGLVKGISPDRKTLHLASGETLDYDLVSFCTGSSTVVPRVMGDMGERVIPVKPVENLLLLRERLLGGAGSLLFVGGGAAGCEVAANAAALVGGDGITILESADRLLLSAPERAGRLMRRHLESVGVTVKSGVEISSTADAGPNGKPSFFLSDGGEVEADLVVAATGVGAPGLFAGSNLSVGRGGGMLVDGCLRSVDDARVFGGGDSISFGERGLPGFGVYAIRQGPVLFDNLLAAATGGEMSSFVPQRRNLYVLGLGDGTGLGIYGGAVWKGRSAGLLKDYIDNKFMREYRGSVPPEAE
ncbi:MAG: NAD(P)/FAD-dependent oxidoreductase [Rubrobacter sp.]